jgi:hypothetical protein
VTFVVEIIAIVLTIAVLSRIAGDNPLFRVAQYLFVGVSLGLAFVVSFHQVLKPAALAIGSGSISGLILYGIPVVLGLLLIPRAVGGQQFSWMANIPLAMLFGVGAALALSGAIIGTLLPQILSTWTTDPTTRISSLIVSLATIIILAGFYYVVPKQGPGGRVVAIASAASHWLLMLAFGFFLAGALQTYLSALTERLQAILSLGLAR